MNEPQTSYLSAAMATPPFAVDQHMVERVAEPRGHAGKEIGLGLHQRGVGIAGREPDDVLPFMVEPAAAPSMPITQEGAN